MTVECRMTSLSRSIESTETSIVLAGQTGDLCIVRHDRSCLDAFERQV